MKQNYFYVKLLSAFSDLPCIFCLIILGDGGDAYITSRTNVTKHGLVSILRTLEFDAKYLKGTGMSERGSNSLRYSQ